MSELDCDRCHYKSGRIHYSHSGPGQKGPYQVCKRVGTFFCENFVFYAVCYNEAQRKDESLLIPISLLLVNPSLDLLVTGHPLDFSKQHLLLGKSLLKLLERNITIGIWRVYHCLLNKVRNLND